MTPANAVQKPPRGDIERHLQSALKCTDPAAWGQLTEASPRRPVVQPAGFHALLQKPPHWAPRVVSTKQDSLALVADTSWARLRWRKNVAGPENHPDAWKDEVPSEARCLGIAQLTADSTVLQAANESRRPEGRPGGSRTSRYGSSGVRYQCASRTDPAQREC